MSLVYIPEAEPVVPLRLCLPLKRLLHRLHKLKHPLLPYHPLEPHSFYIERIFRILPPFPRRIGIH